MNLCFLDDPIRQFTDPKTYSEWMESLDEQNQKIVKEFSQSSWNKIDPATESISVKVDGKDVEFSSRGFSTEETKLFSFVFNAFVFMQVFN